MHQITREQLTRLIAAREAPCVSLYQPTHRRYPENQQDPIRYRNLLVEMEKMLQEQYPTRQVRALVEKFQTFARDERFWNYRTEALAIFGSPEQFELYELQRPVEERLIVADSFHTKPLIRIVQSADRFQILCLTRKDVKLYEGNRDALDELELTPELTKAKDALMEERKQSAQMIGTYGTRGGGGGMAVHHRHESQTDFDEAATLRFFRTVDRVILEQYSRASGLPLMLVALPEYHQLFGEISHNPFLMDDGIKVNPDSLSIDALREQAWANVLPHYLKRLEGLKERFHTAFAQQAGTGDLADAARMAIAGRVETLLVDANRVIPGKLDGTTGSIKPAKESSLPVDDMLDDLAELVLTKGGEVVVVPSERMPTDTGLAAICRF